MIPVNMKIGHRKSVTSPNIFESLMDPCANGSVTVWAVLSDREIEAKSSALRHAWVDFPIRHSTDEDIVTSFEGG